MVKFRFSRLRALTLMFFPNFIITKYLKKQYPNLEYFKIGFSWLETDQIELSGTVEIGHFNFIKLKSLCLKNCSIGVGNLISGNIDAILHGNLGNFNTIRNSNKISVSQFETGIGSKITSHHYLDMCGNVRLGEYSLLAGRGTQIWTHSYGSFRSNRYRIDADIVIGDHTYIGSRAVLQAPLKIGSRVTVASGCCLTGKHTETDKLIVPPKSRSIDLIDASEKLERFEYLHKDEVEPCLRKVPK